MNSEVGERTADSVSKIQNEPKTFANHIRRGQVGLTTQAQTLLNWTEYAAQRKTFPKMKI
jgi:hypothetical protein